MSAFLVLELFVFFTLCAPLPWGVRKNISRWIFRVQALQRLDTFFKYVIFGLALALVESLHAMYNAHVRAEFITASGDLSPDHAMQVAAVQDFRWRKARSERNVYMAGFAITLMFGIMRLVRLAGIEIQLRNKIKEYNGNKPLTEMGETVPDKEK